MNRITAAFAILLAGCSGPETGPADASAEVPDLPRRAISCADGTRNGGETDIDCGGVDCRPCAVGGACASAGDCRSGRCAGGICQPFQGRPLAFAPPRYVPIGEVSAMAVADFDRDGALDVAIAGDRAIELLGGDGNFAGFRRIGKLESDVMWSITGDFDGDGRPDLVSAIGGSSPSVRIDLNRLDGFVPGVKRPGISTGLAAGDADGDGNLDLFIATETSMILLRGTEGGAFLGHEHPFPAEALGVVSADLDGDGLADAVTAVNASVVTLLGRPGGTLREIVGARFPLDNTLFLLDDFDDDGLLDLLVMTDPFSGERALHIATGRGDGSFGPWSGAISLGSVLSASRLRSADLDLDGHADLVCADFGGGGISVLRGRGDGSFAPPLTIPVEARVELQVADLDHDGRPDLVTSVQGDHVAILMNRSGEPCFDGLRDGGETDTDCGGGCSACELGRSCDGDDDCASRACGAGRCVPAPTCTNGNLDGTETDVDCGGEGCEPCRFKQQCKVPADCFSYQCWYPWFCREGTNCTNGRRDSDESDVDCGGGACKQCQLGQSCRSQADCGAGVCVAGQCADCQDLRRDGDETDVDCGGAFCGARCHTGWMCVQGPDCLSGVCAKGRCVPGPSCSNGVRDAGESDVDCGGECDGCAAGRACVDRSDCADLVCRGGVCDTCGDGFTDGDETFTDCGGSHCPPCADGADCVVDRDCAGGTCISGVCARDGDCHNGIRDNQETDIDCGGPACLRCAEGRRCASDGDCLGNNCMQQVCGASKCGNCRPGEYCDGKVCACDGRSCTLCCGTNGCGAVGGLQMVCGQNGAACSVCTSARSMCHGNICHDRTLAECFTPKGEVSDGSHDAACGSSCKPCPRFTHCKGNFCAR